MSSIIKKIRTSYGMTQQQLADRTGINLRQIQKIESGEIKIENISAKNFMALAEAMKISPKELLK